VKNTGEFAEYSGEFSEYSGEFSEYSGEFAEYSPVYFTITSNTPPVRAIEVLPCSIFSSFFPCLRSMTCDYENLVTSGLFVVTRDNDARLMDCCDALTMTLL
jgi:hypothetical protein